MTLPFRRRSPTAARATGGVTPRRNWRRTVIPWLFLLPLVFMNVLVQLGPSVGSVVFAFTDWRGLGAANFVGLENFQRIFEDDIYIKALTNNIKWATIMLTVPVLMGLLGAAVLASVRRFQTFFRVAYFLPYLLASIVNAQVWRSIMNANTGIGPWFEAHGLSFLNIKFFGPATALYSVAFIDTWHWWGFLLVLYLAAMQGIDLELYEAARIEGANRWQEFRHVTLPGIKPTLAYTLLLDIIWSFLVFEYPLHPYWRRAGLRDDDAGDPGLQITPSRGSRPAMPPQSA
ncbi:MAG: sugar ABC transporter permease [Anaerolineae bacterium]|nr:sugar ABC transporter permease [Anaerolineae bacterium]